MYYIRTILTSSPFRAQVTVVKKGLLDEQEKTSHLSEQVKCVLTIENKPPDYNDDIEVHPTT